MPVRAILNRLYVYLVLNLDEEQRTKFDSDLYAPDQGWDAAEAGLFAALDELAGEDQ